jgi:hypothetical protein
VEGQASPPGAPPPPTPHTRRTGALGAWEQNVARRTRDSEGGGLAEYSQPVGVNTEPEQRGLVLERLLKHIFTSIL